MRNSGNLTGTPRSRPPCVPMGVALYCVLLCGRGALPRALVTSGAQPNASWVVLITVVLGPWSNASFNDVLPQFERSECRAMSSRCPGARG